MPEEQDAMGASQEPGPKNYICHAPLNGFQEPVVIVRIVLQIRILNEYHLTMRFLKSATQGRSLAAILFLEFDPNVIGAKLILSLRQRHDRLGVLSQFFQELSCSVGGTVVHNDDLFLDIDGLDPVQKLLDRWPLVVHRDHDGEFGVVFTVVYDDLLIGRSRLLPFPDHQDHAEFGVLVK